MRMAVWASSLRVNRAWRWPGSSRIHSSTDSSRAARRSRLSAWTLALVEIRSTVVCSFSALAWSFSALEAALSVSLSPTGFFGFGVPTEFLVAIRTAYRYVDRTMYDTLVHDTKYTANNGVRAEGLGKRYDDLWALRDLDLNVAPGTVLGLLGHNGAGKTTAIRILTTLAIPTEGSASVAGFDVVDQADQVRRRIGVAAQEATVDGLLTGRFNLEMVGRLYGLPKARPASGPASSSSSSTSSMPPTRW